MSGTNPNVDWFFQNAVKWRDEFEVLREIILDCGLDEELKWGWPCYMVQKKNVVLIHGFKEYCALLFFKGALMSDPKKILIQQTKNVQVPRQIRFRNVREVVRLRSVLKAYVRDAIEVQKSGVKITRKKTSDLKIPPEFKSKLDESPALKKAFRSLTPGRQRGYIFHISSAKQSATRAARVEKCTPRILHGKGLLDD
jgi:uncharacterized protein YdeI (YjbR/CyaY-like superfamily)